MRAADFFPNVKQKIRYHADFLTFYILKELCTDQTGRHCVDMHNFGGVQALFNLIAWITVAIMISLTTLMTIDLLSPGFIGRLLGL